VDQNSQNRGGRAFRNCANRGDLRYVAINGKSIGFENPMAMSNAAVPPENVPPGIVIIYDKKSGDVLGKSIGLRHGE
jgi:hypothetical protein